MPSPARYKRALPEGRSCRAFTLIELLIVMAIIIVLAGLILATSGYVQKKGQRSRAEAEIAAVSAALESYKADNGVYPMTTQTTALKATNLNASSPAYRNASLDLYRALSGNQPAGGSNQKSYFAFKPQMLGGTRDSAGNITVEYLRDPFGLSYGYSTLKAADPLATDGYNPTFDLWSVGDADLGTDQSKWIKNW